MRILLCCAFGASSSLFVAKTKKYIAEKNYDIDLFADAVTDVDFIIQNKNVDAVILAPGVLNRRAEVDRAVGKRNIIVEPISVMDYGKMDGAKVIESLIQKYHLDVTKK